MPPPKPSQKFEPGETIAPLSVKDFDTCHAYLRMIVRKHYKEARRSFRAYKMLNLFEENTVALIDAVREHYNGPKEDVTYENVRAIFTNPCVQETVVHRALADKLIEITGGLPKDKLNVEGVDDVLKQFALENPECPALVVTLAHERPSVFHVLASDYRYNSDILSMFRRMLSDNEKGAGKSAATLIQEAAPHILSAEK